MVKVELNIEHFKSILNQYPNKVIELKNKFRRLDIWLDGKDKPTFNQVGEVANFLNIPFGYFFLSELPESVYPIPHFRNDKTGIFEPSEELKETVKILENRQTWLKEILLDYGHNPISFVGSIDVNTDIQLTVNSIKKNLKISDFKANDFSNWQESLNYLINKTEDAGIFVVINGIVGNNTHRKLNINEFRGFVLNDEIAPFVFINNNDAKSAQIFTLAHELVHIWLGKSASFELRDMLAAEDQVELYCNKVAAEFLVPEEELKKKYRSNISIEKLTFHFKVSRIVIARRLLDLDLISKDDFFNIYNSIINIEKSKHKSTGGNYYKSIPFKLSRKFGDIIYRAAKTGKISYREAFKLTGMKPKVFDKYFLAAQK